MAGVFFFFSSRRRHTRCSRDWSSDVCSSDLKRDLVRRFAAHVERDRHRVARDYIDGARVHTAERSEEHTSELQSRLHLVCRLLLEKKKNTNRNELLSHVTHITDTSMQAPMSG